MLELDQLQHGTTIEINNDFYKFTGSVTTEDSFEAMINTLRNRPVQNDILVVVPGVSAEVEQLISNYILNQIYKKPNDSVKLVSERTLDNASDEELQKLSKGNNALNALWFLLRKQAQYRTDTAQLEAELAVLTAKRNSGAITQEEFERGNLIYTTLLPEKQTELSSIDAEISEQQQQLLKLSKRELSQAAAYPDQSWIAPSELATSDALATPDDINRVLNEFNQDCVDNSQASNQQSSCDDFVQVAPVSSSSVTTQPTNVVCQVCPEWRDARYRVMPLRVARQLAYDPRMLMYSKYQKHVEGYLLVPPEFLIMYGIRMYEPDLPIVFTQSGEFRRIGESDHSPLELSYWYPKPKFFDKY